MSSPSRSNRRRGWRAYYLARTFDSSEVSAVDLPDGLLGIVEFLEPPYRRLVQGGDWYWQEDGRWHSSDSTWGGWVEKPHEDAIRGRAISTDAWRLRQAEMMEDREWP